MSLLVETPSATFHLYQCPGCLTVYAGHGLQLQDCPNCDSIPIASLVFNTTLALCVVSDLFCTTCHVFRPHSSHVLDCLPYTMAHALNHLQPEV